MLTYKKLSEDFSELDSIGIDFFEGKYRLSELSYSLFKSTFESHYTKEGIEWIEWFIFEGDWGQKDFSRNQAYIQNEDGSTSVKYEEDEVRWGATDGDGNPIAYSFESLWELLERDYKLETNDTN
jgi:hypothetical protein